MSIPSIARYLSIGRSFAPSFLGEADEVVYLGDLTGVPQVWLVPASAGCTAPLAPEQLTCGDDRVAGLWTSPVPGDRRLIYGRDAGGNERMQLHLLDVGTGEERWLTASHPDSIHDFGLWEDGGRSIVYSANRRDPGLFDLYRQALDPESAPDLLWENSRPGYLSRPVLGLDGRTAYLSRVRSSFEHDLLAIDLEAGRDQEIRIGTEPGRVVPVGTSWREEIVLLTDRGSDMLRLVLWEASSGATRVLVDADWDVSFARLTPDRRAVVYALNHGGRSEVHWLDLATGQDRVAPIGSGVASWGGRPFSPDGGSVTFALSGPARPGEVRVWTPKTNQMVCVARASAAGIPRSSFVDAELVSYETFDETEEGETRRIPAWLYRPDSEDDVPVIVWVHGGPEGQSRATFNGLAQYFLAHGYAIMLPNVRGSSGYGKAYGHLDDVEKRMDSVADLESAAKWLGNQPGIDGNRLVLFGGSYGGFMVLSGLTTYPEFWAAGVDIVGISHFVTFLENTSDYRRAHREAEYGSLDTDRDFLERISPLNHVDRIAVPMVVIHGANDPRVPLSEAEQLVDKVRQRGLPVEFLVFDDEGHGLAKRKNQIAAYSTVAEFLNEVLRERSTG